MIVTNMVGVAFSATLLAASDSGATFFFPEDGATNTLAWSQLSSSSRAAVCAASDFEPVPPELVAAFGLAQKDLLRLSALEADGRITASEANPRRNRLREAFAKKCAKAGLDKTRIARLQKRLSR